jgi:hypothetical protein
LSKLPWPSKIPQKASILPPQKHKIFGRS